jgi:hypothetical protein
MGKILSYRGLLADGGQDTILLSTKKGEVGYRIIKFQLMFPDLATSLKSVVKVFKNFQDTIPDTISFSDDNMLACGIMSGKADQTAYPEDLIAVFDQEIFNQDIYVTHSEVAGAASINYYIELEAIKLSEQDAMVTTLQSIRSG